MRREELEGAIETGERLSNLLEEEFVALKEQNLDNFDRLQAEKVACIHSLSEVSSLTQANVQVDIVDDSRWDFFMGLMDSCKNLHLRNEILINRKLDATRGALQALQSDEPTSSVEVYDRLGKLYRGGKKRGGVEEV